MSEFKDELWTELIQDPDGDVEEYLVWDNEEEWDGEQTWDGLILLGQEVLPDTNFIDETYGNE